MKRKSENKEAGFLAPTGNADNGHSRTLYPFGMDSTKYSSVTKLVRVTANVIRFIDKTRKCSDKSGSLTSEELKKAEMMRLHSVQRNSFTDVFQAILGNTRNNLQKQLGLYIDEQGMLRCKGRLDNAELKEDARRPVLLPKSDKKC